MGRRTREDHDARLQGHSGVESALNVSRLIKKIVREEVTEKNSVVAGENVQTCFYLLPLRLDRIGWLLEQIIMRKGYLPHLLPFFFIISLIIIKGGSPRLMPLAEKQPKTSLEEFLEPQGANFSCLLTVMCCSRLNVTENNTIYCG